MDITLRAVAESEQADAVRLWNAVFGTMPGYFERYYAADPWYRPGDTVGAWAGDQLVSAVHLCRRPLDWDGRPILMGGIANVATLPDFRRQGLSRQLLRLVIARMEREGVHFSALGTGVPGHYAALGWETGQTSVAAVTLRRPPSQAAELTRAALDPLPTETYARGPRPLQLSRAPAYFAGWARWEWAQENATLLTTPAAYAVVEVVDEANAPARLLEWRAGDAAAEEALLAGVAAWAQAGGRDRLTLEALPQFGGITVLERLGDVETSTEDHGMLRNVSLTDSDYEEIKRLYTSGQACWWPADGF